jgi:hypothetical protein
MRKDGSTAMFSEGLKMWFAFDLARLSTENTVMKAVIELQDKVGRRLEDFARRQGTTLERVVESAVTGFAERLPESCAAPSDTPAELPVVHGTRPITIEELQKLIDDDEYEDDLKQIRIVNDPNAGR